MRTLQKQTEWCTRVHLILAGSIIAGFVLFYVLWYRPQSTTLSLLREKINRTQWSLTENQKRAARLPVVKEEVNRLRARLERFARRMPHQPDLGQFMKDITQISQRSALRKLTVRPGVPQRTDLFCEMPITMSFEGEFMNIFAFLQQTEDMQRLTRVRMLDVHCKDMGLGKVEVKVLMNIYFAEG